MTDVARKASDHASSGLGDHDEILHGLHRLIEARVLPLETEHQSLLEDDRRKFGDHGGYSTDVVELLRVVRTTAAEAGYYGMFAPESVGGAGLGNLALFEAWESLHHTYGEGRLLPYQTIGHWTSGPSFLLGEVDATLRDSVVAEVMSGDAAMCFAMSEPDAGSDARAMSTSARRDGDEWVINGTKQWISGSTYATYAYVFAVTDKSRRAERSGGITCFIVPTSTPGFRVDSVIPLYGHVGSNEGILSFTDVRVPARNVVGEVGRGFDLAIRGVSQGRMYNAARSVGMARWALETATSYAKSRKTFGRPISDNQGISFMLADSAIEIYAAKTMAIDCAKKLDDGQPAVKELSMAKAFATEMCFRVFDRAMQVCGAMGLTNELKLTYGWHQARTVRIADGSSEILRRTIAARLLKGDLSF